MKFYLAIFCSAVLLVNFSCASRSSSQQRGVVEGVRGRVSVKEGNFMPGPDQKPERNSGKVSQRTVYIYAVTTGAQTEGEGPLYKAINRPLVAQVKTDDKGFFECKLAPGVYSLFTGEDGGMFFASLSNGKGELNPVEVFAKKVTVCDIVVNHKAVY